MPSLSSSRRKRRADLHPDDDDDVDDVKPDEAEEEDVCHGMNQLTLLDVKIVEKRVDQVDDQFYHDEFEKFLQKPLKRILKDWIRMCHVSKQKTHMYAKKRRTAPDYWPEDDAICKHTEPDHLNKKGNVSIHGRSHRD